MDKDTNTHYRESTKATAVCIWCEHDVFANSLVKDWLAKLPSHIDSNLELHFGFPQDRDPDAKTTLKNLICGRLRKTYNPLFKVGNH